MSQETPNLDNAIDWLQAELEKAGGNPSNLPPVVRPIAILYTIQAIIDNGGFQYLFENEYPEQPYSEFVDAYRAIGANRPADNLEKAVSFFPFDNPHLDRDRRLEFLESIDEEHEIVVLGDEVCGDESVWELMESYVLKHAKEFHLDG